MMNSGKRRTYQKRRLVHAGLAAGLFALSAFAAIAQQAPSQPAERQSPAPADDTAAAPRQFEPGFLDALGRWFSDSAANVNAGLKGTQDTLTGLGGHAGDAAKAATGAAKGAAEAAVGAAGDVARLPGTRVVNGRQRCELAPNGAPDCVTAANNVCRGGGFGSGRSLDIQSAQKCPARLWLSGRMPAEGECAVETFVTRAVCQ